MAINKVSEITKTRIKEQSVLSLPDKPSEKGYGAQQLKEFFTNIVVGDIGALAEIDRIVVELNRYLDGLENTSIKNYVIDSIVSKFVEQGPFTSLKFEENKLKYTKFGNPTISGEIDIIPDNSVFFNSETLQNKDGAIIYPKTTLDNIVDKMDDKSVKEFLLYLKTKINTIETNHEIDIKTIEDDLNALLGGDAPAALDSIKELAEALKNNPSSIDDILQQLSTIKANKVDKVSGKGLSTNDYDNSTKAFVDELKSKDVALKTDIKTKLSELTQDSNYRTVTDTEKSTWNNKAPKVHTHEIKDVNGLESALESKSNVGHTHTPESIGLDISSLGQQILANHNTSKDSHPDIRAEITEVKNKVDGINNALSFENLSQLTAWFGGTYNRADGKKPSDLYVGQHIYLKDEDEEDYWVSEIPANMSNLSILVTDKIDLSEYAQKNELKRVAFTGKHSDLDEIPTIPSTLAELGQDDNHRTITQEKLDKIDTIDNKLDKNLGSSEANKMIITDSEGNIVTVEAGSMAVMVDNLESTSTDMALAANQGRVLDNKKLDKQLGVENSGKFLKIGTDGIIEPGTIDLSSKLDSFNPSGYGSLSLNRKNHSTIGEKSVAFGYQTTASGSYSHAEGDRTYATDLCSHAEGSQTTASASYSHAEGNQTTASGSYSHAEGYKTTATGLHSHAEGNITIASEDSAHAEGYNTESTNTASHSEGWYTKANGVGSHTEGGYTIADKSYQHVFGEYNALDSETNPLGRPYASYGRYIEMVGNGTSEDNRSNARTLDWNGNETLSGTLYVNGNEEVATLGDIPNTDNFIEKDELSNYYTKTETTSVLSSNYYTKKEVLNALYPIGTIYLTTSTNGVGSSSPASWLGGTWERLPAGYALWTATSDGGKTISAGLPNITGTATLGCQFDNATGAWYAVSSASNGRNGSNATRHNIAFDAKRSNDIYGKSTTVQPPAYRVYAWRRTK